MMRRVTVSHHLATGGLVGRQVVKAALLATLVAWMSFATEKPAAGSPGRVEGSGGLPAFFVPAAEGGARYVLRNGELAAALGDRSIAVAAQGRLVVLEFPGASYETPPEGIQPLPGVAHTFSGTGAGGWRTDMPVYGAVVYRRLYPGIDMEFRVEGRRLKREFVVLPGAEVAQIRMRFGGVSGVELDSAGRLLLRTPEGVLAEDAPVLYQPSEEGRKAVNGAFRILDASTVSFEVGPYDRSLPLVIDPTLSFSTYLAGNGVDGASAVAVDGAGNVYVAGWTDSVNFPSAGGYQTANRGGVDAFVLKLNASGNQLIWATYLGGSGEDRALALKLDGAGNVWVAGKTNSSNFPVAGLTSSRGGNYDGFVAKLSPQGNTLVFSRYLGGSGADWVNALAVDGSGNAWVAGETASANFPVAGAFQPALGGGTDAFLAKITATGALACSTLLGGAGNDGALAIALDLQQRPVIAGYTYSPNLPVAAAFQSMPGGGQDAFVAQFSPSADALVFSTYLGGSQGGTGFPEWATALAVDSTGRIFVGGATSSGNFPTQSAHQAAYAGGNSDAFVTAFNANGAGLAFSTYLGGVGNDSVDALALDSQSSLIAAGSTTSSNFPVMSPYQAAKSGLQDAFVTKLNASSGAVAFSTFFGGNGADAANAVAAIAGGGFVIAGQTGSTDLPLQGAYQNTSFGTNAAFLARFSDEPVPEAVSVSPSSGAGSIQFFTLQFAHAGGVSRLAHLYLLVQNGLTLTSACQLRYNVSLSGLFLRDDNDTAWLGAVAPGSSSTLENSQCRVHALYSGYSASGLLGTLRLAVEFKTAFAGDRKLYLRAIDTSSQDTGWREKGAWTVPSAPNPGVLSASPVDGSSGGTTQVFTFLYAHPTGAGWLQHLYGMIHSSTLDAAGCQVRYNVSLNGLFLMNDAGTAWLGAVAPGSSSTLENSQCRLVAGSSSATSNGVFLTLRVGIQFKNAFAGGRFVYARAIDKSSLDTGWKQFGGWTVLVTNEPTPVSVTPSSGASGTNSQTFQFEFSHGAGYTSLTHVYGMIHSSTSNASGCQIRYNRSLNGLFLMNDAGTSWLGAAAPGSSSTLENSQCRLLAASSSVYVSGTVLRMTVTVQFKEAFAGAKTIYMRALDSSGQDSGWVAKGSWNVAFTGSQSWGGVTPSSGSSGLSGQSFLFEYVDAGGIANMAHLFGMLWDGASYVNACQFRLNRSLNGIYLMNDSNTAWLGPIAPGSSATLENSSCRVVGSKSRAVGSGTMFQFVVGLEFKAPFAGQRAISMRMLSVSGADTGWQRVGTWTVLAQ